MAAGSGLNEGMDRLNAGESLAPGQSIESTDGRFRLTVEPDGNIILSGPGGAVRWSAQTAGHPGSTLSMQADGNLVLYDAGSVAIWATQTWGHPGALVVVQDDGNLVVYAANGQTPLWATNTWLISRHVEGFAPSTSGFAFRNDYPVGTRWPVLDLPIVGEVISADAGNGLCGGFSFAVVDMFLAQPRLVPPRDATRPPAHGPHFDYLCHRFLDSFNGAIPYGTILKVLDWIETPDQAMVWAVALGLQKDAESVLERSAEDARSGTASTMPWFPAWYGTSQSFAGGGGIGAERAGRGGHRGENADESKSLHAEDLQVLEVDVAIGAHRTRARPGVARKNDRAIIR